MCWYRSRQRQLAAYLSNPRNAQIVIVGGRAYLHQMCERQSVSADPHTPTLVLHLKLIIKQLPSEVVLCLQDMYLLWVRLSIHRFKGFDNEEKVGSGSR